MFFWRVDLRLLMGRTFFRGEWLVVNVGAGNGDESVVVVVAGGMGFVKACFGGIESAAFFAELDKHWLAEGPGSVPGDLGGAPGGDEVFLGGVGIGEVQGVAAGKFDSGHGGLLCG